MKLELENGTIYEEPNSTKIREVLSELDLYESTFAILSSNEGFIQAAQLTTDSFILEYKENYNEILYNATNEEISLEQIISVFQSYAEGNDDWKTQFEWQTMDF